MNKYPFLIFLIIFFQSCVNDDAQEISLVFETSQVQPPASNFVFISADITREEKERIIDIVNDHGMIWSLEPGVNLQNGNVISIGKMTLPRAISGRIEYLRGSTTYYYKGFIIINGTTHYSNELSFTTNPGTWKKISDFPGINPVKATCFVINDRAFILTDKELWEYNAEQNSWNKKNEPPFFSQGAASFTYEGFGYIYCGGLWRYNYELDSWENMHSPTNSGYYLGCRGISCFLIGSKAYFGGGIGNFNKSLIEYDILLNSWEKVEFNHPSPNVSFSASFSIDNVGYIVTGEGQAGYSGNILRYDINNKTWDKIDFIPNQEVFPSERTGMINLKIGEEYYLGMGTVHKSEMDLYKILDNMNSFGLQTFPASFDDNSITFASRTYGIGFSIEDKGYIGLGQRVIKDSDGEREIPLFDLWEFDPR